MALCSLPQHQVLLVADGRTHRVLVLHPGDGSHLQTIQPDKKMGMAELCLHQNKLVVRHYDGDKVYVSYFSLLIRNDLGVNLNSTYLI